MIQLYFCAPKTLWQVWQKPLQQALDQLDVAYHLSPDCPDPKIVDYLIYAPGGPDFDFAPFTGAKAVLGLWAGVEDIAQNPSLQIPFTRMVEPGLCEGMVEWVSGHVLRHHLGMDQYITGQDGIWRSKTPPLARERQIVILGLGVLGQACSRALADLRFQVSGWSRSAKNLDGITCYHGADGLDQALTTAEILVCLLPLTPATQHILNTQSLGKLPKAAIVLNPGRGALIEDDALLAALDTGQVGHATLDAFVTEPLPAAHPFWAHPRITVTPHIAAKTRPKTASLVIAENVRRGEAGEDFLYQMDIQAGY
ncbi:D-3-phosphoglycerate dehydrogenase [hydrothermal vent metagenome]|uniref:D-3-phosphoglycerate dehydrogenase n=1 Tax=hydrothermal vent metagenome TaxID=652676 RepID=A0A3B0SII4_9ZZZZ